MRDLSSYCGDLFPSNRRCFVPQQEIGPWSHAGGSASIGITFLTTEISQGKRRSRWERRLRFGDKSFQILERLGWGGIDRCFAGSCPNRDHERRSGGPPSTTNPAALRAGIRRWARHRNAE